MSNTTMRVLLTDGSGLTARQVAGRLAGAGHTVDALAPDPFCLCRFTHHVDKIRRVPPFGSDPMAWLDSALATYADGGYDLLFPTQEQVAVLASVPHRLRGAGVATVVPAFDALAAVQDKASAFRTLVGLGLPQPPGAVGLRGWDRFPAFVKEPIGTASGGVRRVESAAELTAAEADSTDLVVQAAVEGPLAMCQAVFDRGVMVAFHANLRVGEGANGGASRKRSVELAEARSWMAALGSGLGWHGALSADVIVGPTGPQFIDINPRLVEPNNAWYSGVDLVGAMVDLAVGDPVAVQDPGRPGVATHQALLAVLGVAQQGRGRRGVARELVDACRHRGEFSGSVEELTPAHRDPLAVTPLVMASVATLARPSSWSWFTSSSVQNYALTAPAWDEVRRHAEAG